MPVMPPLQELSEMGKQTDGWLSDSAWAGLWPANVQKEALPKVTGMEFIFPVSSPVASEMSGLGIGFLVSLCRLFLLQGTESPVGIAWPHMLL